MTKKYVFMANIISKQMKNGLPAGTIVAVDLLHCDSRNVAQVVRDFGGYTVKKFGEYDIGFPISNPLVDVTGVLIDAVNVHEAAAIAAVVWEVFLKVPAPNDNAATPDRARQYVRPLNDRLNRDIFTVSEWEGHVASGMFVSADGYGFWCKDGKESADDVFITAKQDATHVAWYNK